MKTLLKILLALITLSLFAFSAEIKNRVLKQSEFENQTIFIVTNSFRVLEFDKRIKKIQLSNSTNINADFIDHYEKPLRVLKFYAKKVGNENALVTFYDNKTLQISFHIVQDMKDIIALSKAAYPNLIIQQINDNIVLKGRIKDNKEKKKLIDIFKKANVDVDKKIIDMISVDKPSKMVRVKLYAVEINNDKGLDLKNNWTLSSKNYLRVVDPVTDVQTNASINDALRENAQYNFGLEDALNGIMANAVTLSGGLTGTANYLGKYFNTGLTLNYLASEGVANILDETTLITLETQKSRFHAGGTIYIKATGSTAEGLPITEIREIDYGLDLKIEAKNIIGNDFVHLDITTESTQIDWTNQVDGIPSFFDKSINTTVIVGNQSTIVLGGLIKNSNSKDIDKIPLLGDIPILGFLFKSKAFREGKSELVFFITPEIVDPEVNDQRARLDGQINDMQRVKADGDELLAPKVISTEEK